MVEATMHVTLGFLTASLLALVIIPLIHDRAVRLTLRRINAAMPLSIEEIQTEKDQLRASGEYSDGGSSARCRRSGSRKTPCPGPITQDISGGIRFLVWISAPPPPSCPKWPVAAFRF